MRGPAVTLGLFLLAGCDRSPPPIAQAVPYKGGGQTQQSVTLPTDPAPTTTDPAAKAVVEAALKAHTDGHPDRLDGLKTARKVVAGRLTGPNGPVGNEWQFTWRWPDRIRADIRIDGVPPGYMRRVGGAAWMALGGGPEQPRGEPHLSGILAESFAECLLVVFPLADPQAVFSPATAADVRGKRAAGVRVSGPNGPGAVCHFDLDTKRLVQVAYTGYEEGPTTKEVTVLADKAFNGVTVPERLAIRWNGREVGEWTLTELVFPLAAEAKLFEGP